MSNVRKMGETRFSFYEGSFDFLELAQTGSVRLPNRAPYEKRIENLLACVTAMRVNHNFVVNNDYVSIVLV